MKTAHVYGGSGFLMYVHLGAAQCLYDHDSKPDVIVGTSGGSIVGGFLAGGREPKEALEISKEILPESFVRFNWKCFSRDHWGLFTLAKLETVLERFVPEKFCDVKIPLYVIATDVARQEAAVFSNEHTPIVSVAKAIRASSSVPVLFDTVPFDDCDCLYTDGGVVNNLGVDLPVVRKCDKAYAIRLLSETDGKNEKPKSLKEFLIRVLGCMMSEIERKHIEDASDFSRVVTIRVPYNSMDFLSITPAKIQWMYSYGYSAMESKIKNGKVQV